ncbi:MAG: HD domain-containing protein [Lachnospiraceae bacterium]|nr:HD domain-containing protein [Lachnospiraceae bacterium]
MILEFLVDHQLNLMLMLSGICGMLAIFVCFIKVLSFKRKISLMALEISACMLLIFERYAYAYRGDISMTGYKMVRISNFMVFFLTLFVIFSFNHYLMDLFKNEGEVRRIPVRLHAVNVLSILGEILIIISQFTGFYYTFDEYNRYQRAPGFIVCYVIPFAILLIQLSVIIQYYDRLIRGVRMSLLLFTVIPLAGSLVQIFAYGLSLTSITMVGMVVLLFIFAILDLSSSVERAKNIEIEFLKKEQKDIQVLFEQTTQALATAIDAKDKYTHGHSTRVAEYSRKIAELAGKTQAECDEVYFAGLLHDVGKIGIPSSIINKDGKLTDEEYAEIKKHPSIGEQILSGITKSPYLSIGAHYHHERYDGRGYPEGLKGEDIPDIARIIAVADAYDAMTSKRSYRQTIPQDKVREEIVKGTGTQFDPKYAKIMIHILDLDSEYELKERDEVKELSGKSQLKFDELCSGISEGIHVTPKKIKIRFLSTTDRNYLRKECIPSLIVFDALDGRTHFDEKKAEMLYVEYCRIRFDGETECLEARKIRTEKTVIKEKTDSPELSEKGIIYEVEACKFKDHVMLTVSNEFEVYTHIIALPDSARFAYIGLTGEHCTISNISIDNSEEEIDENAIPRIAEEITYIDGPEGDVPNVQINGWCLDASQGIAIKDGMKVTFHTMSLPTARLIWHTAYIELFYSKDALVNGKDFSQFALIRIDGEAWDTHEGVESKTRIDKSEDFEGWDAWKEINKKGMDVEVLFRRKGNKITVITENCGISIKSVITIQDEFPEIYMALTGDQCAITNIRSVNKKITEIIEGIKTTNVPGTGSEKE